jgi:hypothetical protein
MTPALFFRKSEIVLPVSGHRRAACAGRDRSLPGTNSGTVKSADLNDSSDRKGPVVPRRDRPRAVTDGRDMTAVERPLVPWGMLTQMTRS